METISREEIFNITKDPDKKAFIESHTFDNIKQYIPLTNKFNNKKNNNNNLINQNNLNVELLEKICQKNEQIKIKIILNYSYQNDYFIFNLPTKIIYNKEENKYQFLLNDIIELIHSYISDKIFLNEDYSISYYTCDEKMDIDINGENQDDIKTYYFIGNYPLSDDINYYIDVPSDGCLYLKFRKRISKVKSLRYDIFEEENEEEIDDGVEENKNTEENNYKKISKRAKEKRIGFIIKKVFTWKSLRKHTGNKMSLVEAAEKVGLSKKTLDEYFNQIKEGKKYNFDFNKHKKDKVNVLRGYVKKMNNSMGIQTKGGNKKKNK